MAARRTKGAIVAVAATVGILTGLAAWANASDAEETTKIHDQQTGDPLSIGPWVKDEPPPDLTPIDLENGVSGYLRVDDMMTGSSNPEFIRKTSDHSHDIVLPVYAEDGQTVIGEFVAGNASWE